MHSEPDLDVCRENEDAGQDGAEAASRRDVLASLGRFAYIAPALTLLAEPGLVHAAYGPPRASTGPIGTIVKTIIHDLKP